MLNRILLILKKQALVRLDHQGRIFLFLRAAYLGYLHFRAESNKPIHIQEVKNYRKYKFNSPYKGEVTTASHTIYQGTEISSPRQINLDVFIPVFNRFDLVKPLLRTLASQKVSTQNTNVHISIYVGDDLSNSRTSKLLKALCLDLGIHYIRREQNLGVVKNVNDGFSNSKSDFFLLLNSDVSVGKDFLSRMLEPMLYDKTIGAITALTVGEIQKHLELQPGINWNLIDSHLGKHAPQVVDACTAISYAILIRREAIKTHDLMDASFGIGYGEDSDLHYRIIENGYRSVWNLNLTVCHLGGSSFSITELHSSHQDHGRALFYSRWGKRYHAEIVQHEIELQRALKELLNEFRRPEKDWLWVISPGINPKIGGLLVAAVGVRQIIEHSPYVSLVDISDNQTQLVDDSFTTVDSKTFRKMCKSGDQVILVGLGAIRWWRAHEGIIPKMRTFYFLQGPDSLIDPSGVSDFRDMTNSLDGLITNSDCQTELGRYLFPSLDPKQIEIGTDDAYFSLPDKSLAPSRDIDVLFCLRNEWGKGANISLSLLNYLGLDHKVAIFGSGPRDSITVKVLDLGEISHSQLLSVLRRTKVYVDTSIFEGFGLIPREAADGGAHVFVLPNSGGLDALLEFSNHFTPMEQIWNIPSTANQICSKLYAQTCIGCAYCQREPISSMGVQIKSIMGLEN